MTNGERKVKKPYIGFDISVPSIKQSVCRMLNAAVKYEEEGVSRYQNIHGQMFMADIDLEIRDQLKKMIPDLETRRKNLINIAKKVGCEIYYE